MLRTSDRSERLARGLFFTVFFAAILLAEGLFPAVRFRTAFPVFVLGFIGMKLAHTSIQG